MKEGPQFEHLPAKQEVITILRDRGIGDVEAKDMLLAYDDIGRATADALDEVDGTGNARLGHALEMAQIYFEANYQEYAIQSLEELLEGASDETLRQTIQTELDRMLDTD